METLIFRDRLVCGVNATAVGQGNAREMESPALLEEQGSRAQAVTGGEPDYI